MILVSATFTQSSGTPSTGLTLADISLYLTRYNRNTGAVEVVWDGTQNPTAEIDNIGTYVRPYTGEDIATYAYFARASYTGAVSLDSDHVTGAVGYPTYPAGAIAYIYDVTDSVSGDPVEGVDVWVTTDADGDNIKWRGTTDALGRARDDFGNLPLLDAGTYYFWKQLSGYLDDDNPDIEVVS